MNDMETLEQKATEYSTSAMQGIVDKYQSAPWNEFRDALAEIYLAGAKEALASQWVSVKDSLPEDEEYVLIFGPRGVEPAVWNEHYQCWDDAEGDDNMYDKGVVKLWMAIPETPKPLTSDK